MGDKLEQAAEAKDESTINQAGRDINNHYGPKMYEIIQTIDYQVSRQFEGLLNKHAPALIQNEMLKVEASVNNFKEMMSSRLSEQFEVLKTSLSEELAGEKLIRGVTDSNFQFLFQDSLEQVVRKKEKAPQEVLVELLINKITSPDDSNYLIEEAIDVLKSLNKNHINFILLIDMIIYHTGKKFDSEISDEIKFSVQSSTLFEIKWILNYFIKLDPSLIDFEYLIYKGLILEGKTYINFKNISETITNYCYAEKYHKGYNIRKEDMLDIYLPELQLLLNQYGLLYPYDFKVLNKISNVIAEKSRSGLFRDINRFKEANIDLKEDWTKEILLKINERQK